MFENSADVKKRIFKVIFNIFKIIRQEFLKLVSSTAEIECRRLGSFFLHDCDIQQLQVIWLENNDPIDRVIFEKNFEFFGAWIVSQDTFHCLESVIVFKGKGTVDSDILITGVFVLVATVNKHLSLRWKWDFALVADKIMILGSAPQKNFELFRGGTT